MINDAMRQARVLDPGLSAELVSPSSFRKLTPEVGGVTATSVSEIVAFHFQRKPPEALHVICYVCGCKLYGGGASLKPEDLPKGLKLDA